MTYPLNTVVPGYSTISDLVGRGWRALNKGMVEARTKTTQQTPADAKRMLPTKPSGAAPSTRDLKIEAPRDSGLEKTLDATNTALTVITCHGFLGGVLAPLSIAGGYWSLARAQNVKGRKAHFKAMAIDGVVDFLSLGNGERFPALSGYPTMVEAARGQGCLGQRAPLNSSFHNQREREIFQKQYNKTMGIVRKLYRTPAGRKQLKELVLKYKAFKRAHPKVPAHTFFLER